MTNVMGLADGAKIGSTNINGQETVTNRTLLLELGHTEPATHIPVENSTTGGFTNDTIKQKRSKSINMRFYWICNCTSQGQFLI